MRDSPSLDEDFTTFVAARSPALYRSAWLLTTSAPAAEDLVQAALAKAFVHWRRVQAADDPTAYVHGIVLKTFLSHRRRRSSGEITQSGTRMPSPYASICGGATWSKKPPCSS